MANQLRCTSKSVDLYAATMHTFSTAANIHVIPAALHGEGDACGTTIE